jgi:hypothetical protein
MLRGVGREGRPEPQGSAMAEAQEQSTAQEYEVRAAIAVALTARGGQVMVDGPGSLVVDVGGTVGKAYLMAGFRNAMKMPMRVNVTTVGGPGGTGIGLDVGSRGTGGGYMSGGILGAMKAKKASNAWLEMARTAIPSRIGAAQVPPVPQQPAPPPPPATPGQFTT